MILSTGPGARGSRGEHAQRVRRRDGQPVLEASMEHSTEVSTNVSHAGDTRARRRLSRGVARHAALVATFLALKRSIFDRRRSRADTPLIKRESLDLFKTKTNVLFFFHAGLANAQRRWNIAQPSTESAGAARRPRKRSGDFHAPARRHAEGTELSLSHSLSHGTRNHTPPSIAVECALSNPASAPTAPIAAASSSGANRFVVNTSTATAVNPAAAINAPRRSATGRRRNTFAPRSSASQHRAQHSTKTRFVRGDIETNTYREAFVAEKKVQEGTLAAHLLFHRRKGKAFFWPLRKYRIF